MCDVLIIGAGPCGLFLAAELARHGVRPRLVEKRAAFSPTSRALAVFARTLEVLDDAGVADRLVERGRKLRRARVHAGRRLLAEVDVGVLESPFPFVLSLPQSETERLLAAHAEGLGVELERQVECIAVTLDGDGADGDGADGDGADGDEGRKEGERRASVTLRHADGRTETVRPRWLLACDGAHSKVRQDLGFNYGGVDLRESFIFADARVEWPLPADEVHAFLTPSGSLAAIPLVEQGLWRILVSIGDAEPPDEPALETFVACIRDRAGIDARLSDPRWLTGFTVRQRMAASFRKGRAILLGDAASNHSPAGAQGMNTALQEAYNLAWKLALVLRGAGRNALIDSYCAEREPIARAVLRATGLGTRIITLRSLPARAIRDAALRLAARSSALRRALVETLSELNVDYRGSPIVTERGFSSVRRWGHRLRDLPAGPRAGDRVPDAALGECRSVAGEHARPERLHRLLRGTEHVVLLFAAGAPQEAWKELFAPIVAELSRNGAGRAGHVRAYVVAASLDRAVPAIPGAGFVADQQGAMAQRFGASSPCLYVIRPDGYVGGRAAPPTPEFLHGYLSNIFLCGR